MAAARNEFKYLLRAQDSLVLKGLLRHILQADSHADGQSGYHVRSVYFDDPFDTALREKLDGLPNRKKYRIRLYNHDCGFIRLESREKRNGGVIKESMRITPAQAESLSSGSTDFLLGETARVARHFYADSRRHSLKPVVMIDYRRDAFVFAPLNIRITFDTDLRFSRSPRLFDKDYPLLSAFSKPAVILEVKFDEFLPLFLSSLLQPYVQGPRQAVSKYALARLHPLNA